LFTEVVTVSPTARQDKRHQETRDEILAAARDLVAEKGARKLTVRELAGRVDLTAPALYRYFPDGKDEVLLALAAQDLDHLSTHLLTVPDTLPVDERLIEIGLAYIQFAREHPAELDLLFESLSALSRDTQNGSIELLTAVPLFTSIQDVLREGIAQGVLHARGEDAEEDVMLMWHGAWALVHGLVAVERTHQHHDELFRARARDVLRAFVNGLKTDWTSC
jgi:AcrR family transcriptional regulator